VTLDDLKSYLCEIAEHCETVFYTVGGRHYFCICDWFQHQRIDQRSQQPYPMLDEPDVLIDTRFHPISGESQGIPGNSWLYQGNRGTGDQGIGGSADRGIP